MKANTKAKAKFLKDYDRDVKKIQKKELAKLAKIDKRLEKQYKQRAAVARRELKKQLNRM